MQETYDAIKQQLALIDCDPKTLHQVQERVNQWLSLAKQHLQTPESLPRWHQSLLEKKQQLMQSSTDYQAAIKQLNQYRVDYQSAAAILSKERKKTAQIN